jgi:hypothetical protein
MNKTNWSATLRKIERQFDGLPTPPTRTSLLSQRLAERRTLERKEHVEAILGTLVRMSLVVLLVGGINFWPYVHSCGAGLFLYMGAESLIVIGGLWTVVWTWRVRAAVAHGIALVLVLWGMALVAMQVLPRVGYAKTASPLTWSCVQSGPHTDPVGAPAVVK